MLSFLYAILLITTFDHATPSAGQIMPIVHQTPDLHVQWTELLQKYVDAHGRVDYVAFKAAESQLDTYLEILTRQRIDETWSSGARKAFWINAYNAFTIKYILQHWPVTSIRDIDHGNPWDTRWIPLQGDTISLNMIEHDIIRPGFNDPGVHFALNCAAISCPPLNRSAYRAESIADEIAAQTFAFINDPDFNQIARNTVTLSRIFDWYREDFDPIIPYLNRYSKTEVAPDAKIAFSIYDWTLNRQ